MGGSAAFKGGRSRSCVCFFFCVPGALMIAPGVVTRRACKVIRATFPTTTRESPREQEPFKFHITSMQSEDQAGPPVAKIGPGAFSFEPRNLQVCVCVCVCVFVSVGGMK